MKKVWLERALALIAIALLVRALALIAIALLVYVCKDAPHEASDASIFYRRY